MSLLCVGGLAQAADQVDVNRADAEVLAEGLHGVGPVKAKAIIAYRESHGPFRSVHELTDVDGIGEATVEQNLDAIHLGEQAAAK
nr:helix-hairpin-helix domain-containing protein [Ectothiorhodospira mobilis]